MLDLPFEVVQKQIDKITNSTKLPIGESQIYKEESNEHLETYIPIFDTATIAVDQDDIPIKMSKPHENQYALYSGDCSCKNRNKNKVNLIVLGPSGAGKTTFVDSFLNYLLGIEVYDKFRYKLVDERHIEKQRAA